MAADHAASLEVFRDRAMDVRVQDCVKVVVEHVQSQVILIRPNIEIGGFCLVT